MDIKHRLAILLLPVLGMNVAAGQRCAVQSGPQTAALVELYSSEGCSSCPPADQRLNALRKEAGAASLIVPLALHVTYWDQIGWTDPLAQAQFDSRQAELLRHQPRHVAYTPQFSSAARSCAAGIRNCRPPSAASMRPPRPSPSACPPRRGRAENW